MIPLPSEFVRAVEEMLGSEAPAFFASLDEPPTLALRLNPFRKNALAAAEDPELVNTAVECGVRLLGENRVQEYESKKARCPGRRTGATCARERVPARELLMRRGRSTFRRPAPW